MKDLLNSLNEMVEDTMTKAFNRYDNVQCNESKEKIPFEDPLPFMKSGSSQTKIWDKDTGKMLSLAEATAIARDALARGDKMRYDEIKKQMPAITIHASFNGIRNLKTPHTLTGYVVIDIDHIPAERHEEINLKIQQIASVYICVSSLSNEGLHIIPCIKNLTDAIFKVVYQEVASYISTILRVEYDKSCSDITRLMILNHAPDLYVNENSEVIDASEVMAMHNALNAIPADGSIGLPKYLDKVDQDVAMIPGVRHRNLLASITPRLNRAGFEKGAVIEECVTRYSEPDFQRKEITEIIEYIYEHNKDEFGKNKKTYSFKQRLVETVKSSKSSKSSLGNNATEGGEELSESEVDEFFDPIRAEMPDYGEFEADMPFMIREVVDTKERKDIQWALCISSLAAFGGMIPNLRFYSKRELSPLVSVMWVGPSGSGKGNINTIQRIVDFYDDAIRAWQQETEINPAKAKKKEYDDCMAQYKASKEKTVPCDCGEEPIILKQLHLLTSAHTSENQLAYRIYSNGIFVTFFITEEIASAASNRFQKYGIKNEFWRDSLESGSITIDYKNGDYFKVPEVHLIQIAGGTLSAVQQFIEDQDGGLFARYIYLPLVNDYQYIPLSEMTVRKRDYWAKLQGSINTFAKFTLKSHVEITFSRECLDLLTEKIAACNAKSTYLGSDAMTSFTMRLLNKAMSLCATLTYMHAYDRNELYDSYTADHPQQIACSVQTARLIASWIDYIYYTAAQFIMPLPTGKIAKLKKQDTLTRDILDNLPCYFTTQDLLKVAADKNVSESTIKRRLKDWLSSHLVEKVSHGIYHKVGCVETKLELKAAPTPAPDPTPVPESEPLHHWDY